MLPVMCVSVVPTKMSEAGELANPPLADRLSGFPEHPRSNPALAAVLLESLYVIDAECEAMHYASLHYYR